METFAGSSQYALRNLGETNRTQVLLARALLNGHEGDLARELALTTGCLIVLVASCCVEAEKRERERDVHLYMQAAELSAPCAVCISQNVTLTLTSLRNGGISLRRKKRITNKWRWCCMLKLKRA